MSRDAKGPLFGPSFVFDPSSHVSRPVKTVTMNQLVVWFQASARAAGAEAVGMRMSGVAPAVTPVVIPRGSPRGTP